MNIVRKIDLKNVYKPLYHPKGKDVVLVDVPAFTYLMVDGAGDPNTSNDFAEAAEALFSVSHAAKFKFKKGGLGQDYAVMPLEGLWWTDDMATFSVDDKSNWKWTLMIMQPLFVPKEGIRAAIAEVRARKRLPGLDKLRLEAYLEGRCAQVLHIGPFSEEGPTLERLHHFIGPEAQRSGKHHEIYLSDIRRADPSKWKTILRQPIH